MEIYTRRGRSFCRHVCVSIFLSPALAIVGCGKIENPIGTEKSTESRSNTGELKFELGVIARGRIFRFIIPFSELGLGTDDAILSHKSSCECVVTQELSFESHVPKNFERAIEVIVTPDSESKHSSPTALAVRITIEMQSGKLHTFTARFVEASII